MHATFPPEATTPSPPFFTDYAALLAYLGSRGLFRIIPGLDRMSAVLDQLGLRNPPFIATQVVGTNGKGSTSTMLANIAMAHGLSTGLYTSPHFISPRERIRINGEMLEEKEWARLANDVMSASAAAGSDELSYFELITAMAVLAFSRRGVHFAVMETGLGGSWDATTALGVDLVLFTPIDCDHQAILGPTLTDIAADKAGAMRPGIAALSLPQRPETQAELAQAARKTGAPLTIIDAAMPLPIDNVENASPWLLSGPHQKANARIALAGWRYLTAFSQPHTRAENIQNGPAPERLSLLRNLPVSDQTAEAFGIATAWLPGRMQRELPRLPAAGEYSPCALGRPPLLLDGAHNPHGLAALGLALAREGIAPAAVIFASLLDKNPAELAPHLRALATGPIFVPPITDNPRAMPPEDLAALIGLNATPTASLKEALEMAATHMAQRIPESFSGKLPQNPLLICGSLYLLGECYALFPDLLKR